MAAEEEAIAAAKASIASQQAQLQAQNQISQAQLRQASQGNPLASLVQRQEQLRQTNFANQQLQQYNQQVNDYEKQLADYREQQRIASPAFQQSAYNDALRAIQYGGRIALPSGNDAFSQAVRNYYNDITRGMKTEDIAEMSNVLKGYKTYQTSQTSQLPAPEMPKEIMITPSSQVSELLKQGLTSQQIFSAAQDLRAQQIAAQNRVYSPIEQQFSLNRMKLENPAEFVKITNAVKADIAKQTLQQLKQASGIKTDFVQLRDGSIVKTEDYIKQRQADFDKTVFGRYNKVITGTVEPWIQSQKFPKALEFLQTTKLAYDPSADIKFLLFSPLFSSLATKKGTKTVQVEEKSGTKVTKEAKKALTASAQQTITRNALVNPQENRNLVKQVLEKAQQSQNPQLVKDAQKLFESVLGKEKTAQLFSDVAKQEGIFVRAPNPQQFETLKTPKISIEAETMRKVPTEYSAYLASLPRIVTGLATEEQSRYANKGLPFEQQIWLRTPQTGITPQTVTTQERYLSPTMTSAALATATATKTLSQQLSNLELNLKNKEIELLKEQTATQTALKTIPIAATMPLTSTATATATATQTATRTAEQYLTTTKTIQRLKQPERIKIKPFFMTRTEKKYKSAAKKALPSRGFDIAIKRHGKYKTLPLDYSLSYRSARGLAERKLLGSLAASAQLIPSKKPLKNIMITSPDERLFRSPIKKGRETFNPFKIIQKSSYKSGRISTPQEKREIQMARKSKKNKYRIW